ncbi:MAG: hypothetical protein Q4G33_10735 [bacterium]|nr:hypothetical protein [bacterium]
MNNVFQKKIMPTMTALSIIAGSMAATAIPAGAAEGIPEGAKSVHELLSNSESVRELIVDAEGTTRTAAASNKNDSIYYIGDYTLSHIDSIEASLSLTDRDTDTGIVPAQVKFAYMNIEDGVEVDAEYISANSKTIRDTSHRIGTISGTTKYDEPQTGGEAELSEEGTADGEVTTDPEATAAPKTEADYLGAVYTINKDGVTVDADAYAAFPGGTATVDAETSEALKTDKAEPVHLFVYATAQKGRAVMDYIKINERELEGAAPMPEGAKEVASLLTNAAGTRQIIMDSEGGKKAAGSANNNNTIYYLGDYDLAQTEKIEVRASFIDRVDADNNTIPSQLRFAYMEIEDGDVVDADYLENNSAEIRDRNKRMVASVAGTTVLDKGADKNSAEDYAGAVYTISKDAVTVDADGYAKFPGGTAAVAEGSQALTERGHNTVHLFMYSQASNKGRVVTDYVKVYSNETVVTPTPDNGGSASMPEGAKDVASLLTNAAGTRQIIMDSANTKKTAGSANNNSTIYYLGDYDLAETGKIEVRASFIDRVDADNNTIPSQLRFAYMEIEDGDVVDADYLENNSAEIRDRNKRMVASVAGTTVLDKGADKNSAEDYAGAVYTISKDEVTVDADGYAKFPGGTAAVAEGSQALTERGHNTVHLFMYSQASNKGRVVADYVKVYSNDELDTTPKPSDDPTPAKPEIVISSLVQSDDKTSVSVNVTNPTAQTEAGVLIAALYNADNSLAEVKIVENGTAEFTKTETGYIKAFVWSGLSCESGMQSLADAARLELSAA